MTADDARERALALREALGIEASFRAGAAEKRIVEIVVGQPPDRLPEPGPRRDHRAWIVTLVSAPFSIELTLDDATGALLRVRRPRGAGLEGSAR